MQPKDNGIRANKTGKQWNNTLKQNNVLDYREVGEDISLNFTMSQSVIRQMDLKDPRNDGSIRVDPYAFNQSKVIATERKLIALAETDREMTKV